MARKATSKQAIFETAVRLAQGLPVGKLTVTALCAELGIVKSSFYRYYQSLKDVFTDALPPIKDEVLKKSPEILLSNCSNVEKLEQLWDVATQGLVQLGPRVMAYILQFDGKNYVEKHFYEADPFVSINCSLLAQAQQSGEITNHADAALLFHTIHTFFVGNNTVWASASGAHAYDYRANLLRGIRSIIGAAGPLP